MRLLTIGIALILCSSAQAQRLQPGEVRITIGSWKGTAEIDAFTRKERLILSTERGGSGLVLRCMDNRLTIGWFEGLLGQLSNGDQGELSLRVDDDVIGPFPVRALSKAFAIANLASPELDRIAKAKKEIGFQIAIGGRVQTGGLGAIKTSDVAARLRRSCAGQETISPENKEKLAPSGEGRIEEKAQ